MRAALSGTAGSKIGFCVVRTPVRVQAHFRRTPGDAAVSNSGTDRMKIPAIRLIWPVLTALYQSFTDTINWSARRDSNSRCPAPKAGDLTWLAYTPKTRYYLAAHIGHRAFLNQPIDNLSWSFYASAVGRLPHG